MIEFFFFFNPRMLVFLFQAVVNKYSLKDHHTCPEHFQTTAMCMHQFLHFQSLLQFNYHPTTTFTISKQSSHHVIRYSKVFSSTQQPAGYSLNFYSSNNLASTYPFNLLAHSSTISNSKERLLFAYFLPLFLC